MYAVLCSIFSRLIKPPSFREKQEKLCVVLCYVDGYVERIRQCRMGNYPSRAGSEVFPVALIARLTGKSYIPA
jgi:hypothetical protein